jgi:transcriptional regulator with XRE-family HTH domain
LNTPPSLPNTPLDITKSQLELELPDVAWAEELAVIVGSAKGKNSNPKFTGMKLYAGDPDKYDRIVMERTKMGMTLREIAALERVSPQTVRAVMQLEEAGKTAEQYRDETQTDLAVAVKMTMGRITECLEDDERMKACGPRDLAYLLKELTEKKELLSGGATHRGEVTDRSQTDKDEALRHAKQAEELLGDGLVIEDAEVVEREG